MHLARRTLILGTSALARRLAVEIRQRPGCAYSIIGIVGEGREEEVRDGGHPFLGTLHVLQEIIAASRPDRIIVALAERRSCFPVERLLEAKVFRGISVEAGVDVYERLTGQIALESLTPSNVIFSDEYQPSRSARRMARVVSLCTAVAGLVVCLPLFALIALAIRLDSPGPVLFMQERAGLGGRAFRLLKFRSMRLAAGPVSEWERDNGGRITRVGRWLRRFRLDELPQFINVLRGQMNLVGPRPHPISNYELFVLVARNMPQWGEQIPYYSLRWSIPPGITGWAQVRYKYANGLDEEMEKLRYDLYYIKHYSPLLDLRILLETVMVVLRGRVMERGAGPVQVARERTAGSRMETLPGLAGALEWSEAPRKRAAGAVRTARQGTRAGRRLASDTRQPESP